MKTIAFFMLAGGFVAGAYATALDTQDVNWTLFVIAAAIASAGVIIAKRTDRAKATSGEVLENNRNELRESIANIVRDLGELREATDLHGEPLRQWIDDRLRPDLRRFAEARESMVHLFGLQTYADIMSEFAAGERYINRVWSSSADGYDEESRKYIDKAAEQFSDAQAELTKVMGNA